MMRRLVDAAIALLLIAASGVVCANVLSRFVLGTSLFGSDDFTLLLLLWMTFLAAIPVAVEGRHFSMPLLLEAVGAAPKEALLGIIEVVSLVALVGLAVSSFSLLEVYAGATQISLGIDKRIYAAPVILGSLGMVAAVVYRLWTRLAAARTSRHPENGRS